MEKQQQAEFMEDKITWAGKKFPIIRLSLFKVGRV